MTFQVGNSGYHASRSKPYTKALRVEMAQIGFDEKTATYLLLREFAKAQIEKARAGDVAAFQHIIERLDGKPVQIMEHSGPEGRPIERIVHEVVYIAPVTGETLSPIDTPAISNGKGNGAGS